MSAGENLAAEFNVIVEIPMNGDPVKFEIDKVLAVPIERLTERHGT